MARTTSNLTEAINLLEIIKRIPFHSKITSTALYQSLEAKKIKMSLRTLQRALDALQKSDLGIVCDKSSKPYGYSRKLETQELNVFKLDDETSLLLRLAQEHLKYQMPAQLTDSLDYLFSQSKEEEEKEPRSHQWLKKVAVVSGVLPQMPPEIKPRIFNAVTEGLMYEKQLKIEYINTNRERSKLTVLPLGLVQQESRLYLVCQPVDDPTTFKHMALHRMQSVKVTDVSFITPPNFSLKKYVDKHHFNYGHGDFVRLSFIFSNPRTAVNLTETPFNETQKIRKLTNGKHKGKYRLTVNIENSLLLKSWIETWKDEGGFEDIRMKPLKNEAGILPA